MEYNYAHVGVSFLYMTGGFVSTRGLFPNSLGKDVDTFNIILFYSYLGTWSRFDTGHGGFDRLASLDGGLDGCVANGECDILVAGLSPPSVTQIDLLISFSGEGLVRKRLQPQLLPNVVQALATYTSPCTVALWMPC